ncbi:MAG: hypothetical protein ABIF82_10785 [Planctomycetota bacterium]
MSTSNAGSTAFERLKRISSRYRAGASAAEFFVRLVRLSAPALVAALTLIFLSKLLWPRLFSVIYVVPAWLAGVSLYLYVTRRRWCMLSWKANAATDLRSGNRGVYMALQEAHGEDWAPDLAEDDVRIKGRFPAPAAATAAALLTALVVVALLPDLRPPTRKRGGAATPVKKMAELVRILDTDKLADPEYVEKTKDLIKELQEKEEQSGKMDSEDWQALDQCKEELKRQTLDSFRRFESDQELAKELSEKLQKKMTMDEREQLAEMLKNKGAEGLKNLLKEKLDQQGLSDEQLEALANAAEQMSPEMFQKLMDKLQECESPGAAFSDAEMKCLSAVLEAMQGELAGAGEKCAGILLEAGLTPDELAAICAAVAGGAPGKGGITRGPGPAPLEYINKTDENLGKFQAKTFRGRQGDPTVDLGHIITAPDESDVEPGQVVPGGPMRRFGPGNERLTWNARLLPRHNDVLKRYFKSQD